ncbi:class I SAM-dependent methyltransferase [Halorussus halophilus]|uniref:class I SAM-dependent methyltransferase n=1 Tax=Halorussus halophilus TaxID=2650975 RepID=UPI0013010D3C|nr:class I SAM-dependent methyltransferase [Halorussus halophilus]
MSEALYADRPDVYDALYATKEYDAEVEFVRSKFEEYADTGTTETGGTDHPRALVVGCGTGEHSKRLSEAGFEVTGVDKYPAMVEHARTKSDAEFRVGELPDLEVEGEYDFVWLPFTVLNHLSHDDVAPSLRTLADALADGGLLVFDQLTTDVEDSGPRLHSYPSEDGTYARLTHVHERGESEFQWDSLVFTPGGEFFVDTHRLYDHDPKFLSGVCEVLGLSLDVFGWYDGTDPEAGSETFVAVYDASNCRKFRNTTA